MFCLPTFVGRELDWVARDRRHNFSLTIDFVQGLSKTSASKIFRTLLEPGCSMYFLYLFMHSVWTDIQARAVCAMYSCGRKISATEVSTDEARRHVFETRQEVGGRIYRRQLGRIQVFILQLNCYFQYSL